MIDSPEHRWRYRLDYFQRAQALLEAALEEGSERRFSELELAGVVQRFEFTFELGWKMLADYLAAGGTAVSPVIPKRVIRSAFAAELISDGDGWIAALNDRNRMSHIYSGPAFEEVVAAIRTRYAPLLSELRSVFASLLEEEDG